MGHVRKLSAVCLAILATGLTACVTQEVTTEAPRKEVPVARAERTPSDSELLKTYNQMNATYERLWTKRRGTRIAIGRTDTFQGYPYLVLEGRASRSKPDFYSYLPRQDGGATQEFGAFFDRNNDGKTDWLVFNGGILFAEGMKFAWFSHHVIDRNFDGRFDAFVVDDVDQDGNSLVEPGVTAWLYDDNFDGLLDRGAIMAAGRSKPMAVTRGRLVWKRLTGASAPKVGEQFLGLFDKMRADIDGLL